MRLIINDKLGIGQSAILNSWLNKERRIGYVRFYNIKRHERDSARKLFNTMGPLAVKLLSLQAFSLSVHAKIER